jgi:hypothetical protein
VPQVVDVRDYKELSRKAREAGPEIRREMMKRLRVAGKIGADAARLKIRAWPVSGGISHKAGGRAHRGLRSTLAARISVSASGRNVVIRQGAGGITGQNSQDLPRDIDRGGWYHPVYGRGPASYLRAARPTRGKRTIPANLRATAQGRVFQTGWPYFKSTIAAKRPEMLAEVSKVLDDITDRLT